MPRPWTRSKKLRRACGGNPREARTRHTGRGLVSRRDAGGPKEQAHLSLGQERFTPPCRPRSTDPIDLSVWCGLSRPWIRGIQLDNLKRGVANGRAEELTLIVGHLQEPARPAPRIAADLGIGQVAHDCQRLIAGGRPVRQFNPFFVRQDAVAEVEMEEIKRHMTLLDSPRLNPAVRSVWHPRGDLSARTSTLEPTKFLISKLQVPISLCPGFRLSHR